jgi:hypothetical protein
MTADSTSHQNDRRERHPTFERHGHSGPAPRHSSGRVWILAVIVLLAIAAGLAFVFRDELLPQSSLVGESATPEAAGEDAVEPEVQINGYRSATFGMTEEEVRQAIATDFGIGEDGIRVQENERQRTKVLQIATDRFSAQVADHLAIVSYIFGYSSQRLIEVKVVWGTDITPDFSAADFNTKAALLRTRLRNQNFEPAMVREGVEMEDGSQLLFQGEDNKGRGVILLMRQLQREAAAESEGAEPQQETIYRLLLSYVESLRNPDIYTGG